MLLISSKNKFIFHLIGFWLVSLMIFAPTANILFSLPSKVQAADPPLWPVTYGASFGICAAAKALGLSAGLAALAVTVPTADASSWGSLFEDLDMCAQIVGDKLHNVVVQAVTMAANAALNQLLSKLTNQIIQCIQSYDPKTGKCASGGKKGFVLDWNQMLQDAANVAGAKFLNSLTSVNLCSIIPKAKLQMALLPVPEFNKQAECTLDKIVGNIDDFYNDFSKGGWVAWNESLKPNNNAFGTWLMATNKKITLEYAAIQKAEKETKNGFKATKKCLKPSGVDPDSIDCQIAVVTTPSGTVETAVNFAALSPIRKLEGSITAMYSNMGPFGPYLTAISNALLNKLFDVGMSSLISAITEEDLKKPNPYQNIIDEQEKNYEEYPTASENQKYSSVLIDIYKELNKYITNTAKPTYFSLLATATKIKDLQDKTINDFWSRGVWGSAIVATLLGPTTTSSGNQITVATTYLISHNRVGQATIEKRETTYTDPVTGGTSTSTVYTLLDKKNQIEDIDGIVTKYTDTYNSLSYTQSQIGAAQEPIQNIYNKITYFLTTWDGTKGDDIAKADMDTAIATDIPYIQNVIPSKSSTLKLLYDETLSFYNTTVNGTTAEIQNQTQTAYDNYFTEVQNIYNSLSITP